MDLFNLPREKQRHGASGGGDLVGSPELSTQAGNRGGSGTCGLLT